MFPVSISHRPTPLSVLAFPDLILSLFWLVIDKIRENPKLRGLVYANGMYITKHAVGIYGKGRPKTGWAEQSSKFPSVQQLITDTALPPLVTKGEGPLKVEAFIIRYDKSSSSPKFGVALGTLTATGERTLAMIDANGLRPFHFCLHFLAPKSSFSLFSEKELLQLQESELVGRIGTCTFDQKTKRNKVSFTTSKL